MNRGRLAHRTLVSVFLASILWVTSPGARSEGDRSSAAEVLLKRAIQTDRAGDYKEALELFSRVIEANYRLDEAFWRRAAARADLGDLKGAQDDYQQALTVNPRNASAWASRCLMKHRRAGDPRGALADCDEAIRLAPRMVHSFVFRGLAHFDLGDQPAALADFSRAIHLDPAWALPLANRGAIHFLQGRWVDALTDLDLAIELRPDRGFAYPLRAAIREKMRNHAGAAEDMRQAATLTGGGSKFEREAERLEALARGTTRRPGPVVRRLSVAPGQLARAMELAEQAQQQRSHELFFEALDQAEAAAAGEPGNAAAWFLVGHLYAQVEHDHLAGVMAEDALVRALSLSPRLTKARLLLASVQLKRSSFDLALGNLEEALRQDPRLVQPEIIADMCRAYLLDGQGERGEAFFSAVLGQTPGADSARLALAILRLEHGERSAGLTELEQVVDQPEARPENRQYAQMLLAELRK